MEKHKPYVKRIRISVGKTPEKAGQAFGRAWGEVMEFIRERRTVAFELVAERVVFVRGRGKRLTRVSKTLRDRLVVTMPKPGTLRFGDFRTVPAGRGPIALDSRAGGRRR